MKSANNWKWGRVLLIGAFLCVAACEASTNRSPLSSGEVEAVAIAGANASFEFDADQLVRALASIAPAARDRIDVDRREEFFQTLVLRELIFAEGLRAGLGQDPQIQEALANQLRYLVEAKVLENLAASVEISDAEVAAYYQENQGAFSTRKIRVRHILLPDREDAEKVRQQALANPEAFSDLARQYSTDATSSADGGDLGFFGHGKMDPDFEQAAFSLEEPLQIATLVESPAGFHVIQATDFRPGRERSLEEVRSQIGKFLRQREIERQREAFFARLLASVDVSMDPEAMDEAFEIIQLREVKRGGSQGAH